MKTIPEKVIFSFEVLLVAFLIVATGTLFAQEATETPPDTTITEETTTTTSETTETAPTGTRFLSEEDLSELTAAQESLVRADAVLQYLLTKIVQEYGINTQTHGLNIKTGAITPRSNPTP